MGEHEKLKAICDEIGYEIPKWKKGNKVISWSINWFRRWDYFNNWVDVREIIFTPEFMDKIKIEIYNKYKTTFQVNLKIERLMNNLDNPVDYLYKTLNLWKK